MEARRLDVLLIEDDPRDARLFREALGDLSAWCQVTVAKNGAEALDMLFRRGKFSDYRMPDLIVLDLNLPILSGHEVLTALKANEELSIIPVIVLTTSQQPADIRKAYDLGAASYILKPHDLEQFIRIAQSLYEFWYKRVSFPAKKAVG